MERTVEWLLVLAAAVLVFWIRTLPLALHGTDAIADRVVRSQQYARVEQEAAPARLSAREIEARVNRWIEHQPAPFEHERARLSARLQEQLRYEGPDQREYVYLGDVDSYAWLRLARNYVETGTTCDAVVEGTCRNLYDAAPLGRTLYSRSLHVAAIVGLHSIIQLFRPAHPLPATSFWVPVIIGTLGVLPAFFIGRRLSGLLGGVSAALLVSVHPVLLERSIGGDNDVWNVVLPLFMVWAAMAAVAAARPWHQVAWAVMAATFAALHAATWSGWVFTYAVVLAALLGNLLLRVVGHAVSGAHPTRPGSRRGPQPTPVRPHRTLRAAPGVQAAARVAAAFYVITGVLTWVAAPERAYVSIPLTILRAAGSPTDAGSAVADQGVWPDVLATVRELQRTDWGSIISHAYGPVFCAAALLGALLLLLPTGRWRHAHVAVCIGGGAVYAFVATHSELGAGTTLCLVGAPLMAAVLLQPWDESDAAASERAPALIAVVWYVAGLYAAFSGTRFLLLLGPGLGLTIAAALGRMHEGATQLARRLVPRYQAAAGAVLFVGCAALLLAPVREGYATANRYLPKMDDAWWDMLTNIRNHSAPDAIVNTWWDYGYWVEYVAERRTTADGSLLRTHLPYWLGRTLVSASERESLGLLRMLNCGSEATPLEEGRHGAYGKIFSKVGDAATAQSTVVDLARLGRPAAAAYLAERGFTTAEQDDVLASTHCTPPQTFLIISSQLAAHDTWMRLGLWDMRRAYIARTAARLPQPEAVADFTRRFGYTQPEAAALYAQARTTPRSDFVIGPAPRAPSRPYPCRPGQEPTTVRCPLGLFDKTSKRIVDEFVFNVRHPELSRLRYRPAEPGRPPGRPVDIAPGALLVTERDLIDVDLPQPRYAEAGVLMDTHDWRILVGPPPLIRSTFTHLLYLDGRYATHYMKFDERVTYLNDRIITYEVSYEDP